MEYRELPANGLRKAWLETDSTIDGTAIYCVKLARRSFMRRSRWFKPGYYEEAEDQVFFCQPDDNNMLSWSGCPYWTTCRQQADQLLEKAQGLHMAPDVRNGDSGW